MDEQDLQRLNELLGQQGKSVSDLIRTLNARISRGDLSRDVRDALAILNKNSKKLDEKQKKQIASSSSRNRFFNRKIRCKKA